MSEDPVSSRWGRWSEYRGDRTKESVEAVLRRIDHNGEPLVLLAIVRDELIGLEFTDPAPIDQALDFFSNEVRKVAGK